MRFAPGHTPLVLDFVDKLICQVCSVYHFICWVRPQPRVDRNLGNGVVCCQRFGMCRIECDRGR